MLSGMITALAVAQDLGRVTVEAVPVQDFTVIKADMAIKAIRATRVVIIIRGVSSSNRVTRAISGQYHVFTTSLC